MVAGLDAKGTKLAKEAVKQSETRSGAKGLNG